MSTGVEKRLLSPAQMMSYIHKNAPTTNPKRKAWLDKFYETQDSLRKLSKLRTIWLSTLIGCSVIVGVVFQKFDSLIILMPTLVVSVALVVITASRFDSAEKSHQQLIEERQK